MSFTALFVDGPADGDLRALQGPVRAWEVREPPRFSLRELPKEITPEYKVRPVTYSPVGEIGDITVMYPLEQHEWGEPMDEATAQIIDGFCKWAKLSQKAEREPWRKRYLDLARGFNGQL